MNNINNKNNGNSDNFNNNSNNDSIISNYIPKFWLNNNNNNGDNDFNINNNSDNNNSNNSFISNTNIYTILKKYQKIFYEIENLVQTWEYAEANILVVFDNITSFLERLNLLNVSPLSNSSNNSNQSSNDLSIKNDYFNVFNSTNNSNDNSSSSNKVSELIEMELKLKIINKLEESMSSICKYQNEFKSVVESCLKFRLDIDQYWNTNIFPNVINNSYNNISSSGDKNLYLKINELNLGGFNNTSVIQIDQWLHYIVNSFKMEFQRREAILKDLDYTKSQDQLSLIFKNYNSGSTISIYSIKEIIPKVIGVIKDPK